MSIISSTSSCNTYLLGLSTLFSPSSSSNLSSSTASSVYFHQFQHRRCCCALKTGTPDSYSPDLLRKPVVSNSDPQDIENLERDTNYERVTERESWVDWEDQILEDTVPLVGFVRMILHSGKYQSGDRLSAEHEKMILERLLPYHPECDKKIGCGVDYITIGYHPEFQESRCMFIVRTDGEFIDFSYWKCIKGFIRKNYPLYAESFILKHFRRRRQYE